VEGAALGAGSARVACRDGDAACDADGAANGSCAMQVALCADGAACAGVRVRGAAGAALASAAQALVAGDSSACTAAVPVAVRRHATLRATAGTDRARLRLACVRAGAAGGRAVVATTDFETGLLAVVGVKPPRRARTLVTPIFSDAVIRTGGGYTIVLNRFLADNVQVLRRDLTTQLQCTTGAGSNPHDIAVVAPDKAYVTRYGATALWIVDPSARSCDGFHRGSIDLSAFADADGLPEMDQTAVVGDTLFVAVQRLDRNHGFAPSGPSLLVVVDTTSDAVVGSITLHGANAFGDASGIAHEPGTGKLVVSTPGNIYKIGDGGLERVDPATRTADGYFFVTEDQVGGNITDFVLVSATKAYAIVQDASLTNALVAFDPSGASPPRTLLRRDGYLPDVALAPDGLVWLADQSRPTPGIRVFDPATDAGVTRAPIALELPPFSMGFVP
jgi:hypothetical protein